MDESTLVETVEADVVVVGMGLAGICAARAALEEGASVICLEKGAEYHLHSHQITAINSKIAKEQGVEFSDEQLDRILRQVVADGRVVTGKTGNLLGAASALLMNALKGVSGVDDELYVISDDVLEPICHLKTEHLKSHNPRLHSDETLLALSISSVHNPLAAELIDNADKLRGCDAYFSVIISAADEKLYKTLGINVCCEPKYEQHRFYHK